MDTSLVEYRDLSLTGRLAVALHGFDRYCRAVGLEAQEVSDLLDYLWRWPLIEGPEQFSAWESNRPILVEYGLGAELPETLAKRLLVTVDPDQFHSSRMGQSNQR